MRSFSQTHALTHTHRNRLDAIRFTQASAIDLFLINWTEKLLSALNEGPL